jgi:hypothetical protein
LTNIKWIIKANSKFIIVHEELTYCIDDLDYKALTWTKMTGIIWKIIEIDIHLWPEEIITMNFNETDILQHIQDIEFTHVVLLRFLVHIRRQKVFDLNDDLEEN